APRPEPSARGQPRRDAPPRLDTCRDRHRRLVLPEVRHLAALQLPAGRAVSALRAAFAATALLSLCAAHAAAQDAEPLVYRVPVTGVIELGLAPFIERSLAEAAAAGASLV